MWCGGRDRETNGEGKLLYFMMILIEFSMCVRISTVAIRVDEINSCVCVSYEGKELE